MILFQSVIEILAVAMPHTCAQGRPDRTRITVVPIRGDPVGRYINAGFDAQVAPSSNESFI
jgi:hypothetical protein